MKYETDCKGIGDEFTAYIHPEPKVGDIIFYGAAGEIAQEYLGNNRVKTVAICEEPYNESYVAKKPYDFSRHSYYDPH